MAVPTYDAIVLAGGRARRAGGAKLALRSGGRSLLEHALAAVAGARLIVAVGPETTVSAAHVRWCREDPPFTGPVAGIGAALPQVSAQWVVVLAGDHPHAAPAVPALLAAVGDAVDVAAVVDAEGMTQPLLAVYARRWLAARVAAGDAAARSLLAGARVAQVPDQWDAAADIDTLDEAARQGFSAP